MHYTQTSVCSVSLNIPDISPDITDTDAGDWLLLEVSDWLGDSLYFDWSNFKVSGWPWEILLTDWLLFESDLCDVSSDVIVDRVSLCIRNGSFCNKYIVCDTFSRLSGELSAMLIDAVPLAFSVFSSPPASASVGVWSPTDDESSIPAHVVLGDAKFIS